MHTYAVQRDASLACVLGWVHHTLILLGIKSQNSCLHAAPCQLFQAMQPEVMLQSFISLMAATTHSCKDMLLSHQGHSCSRITGLRVVLCATLDL
jgi:hypothetical protein